MTLDIPLSCNERKSKHILDYFTMLHILNSVACGIISQQDISLTQSSLWDILTGFKKTPDLEIFLACFTF